jgi:predicted CXXCH cytochrome family protein
MTLRLVGNGISARGSAALVFIAVITSCLLYSGAIASGDIDCLNCHRNRQMKLVHAPYSAGECVSCHQATELKHPENVKGAFKKFEPLAKVCISCHASYSDKRYVHQPVASGDCTLCHEPHQSNNAKLLITPVAELCHKCHPKNKFARKFPHSPVETSDCLSCHEPHQSIHNKLLKKADSLLCYDCHDKAISSGKSVHIPAAEGDCITCHDAHGSQFDDLLKKDYPKVLYLPYAPGNYDLCFSCHNRDLAADNRTETLTRFRNGDLNLHKAHVNRIDKGRTCRACHSSHASGQEMLIKEKVTGFGKWQIPIRYEKNENGGTCVVGCHKPQKYDRLNTVD